MRRLTGCVLTKKSCSVCRSLRKGRRITRVIRLSLLCVACVAAFFIVNGYLGNNSESRRVGSADSVEKIPRLQDRARLRSTMLAKYKRQHTLAKIPGIHIYLFSALFGSNIHGNDTIQITAWMDRNLQAQNFTCCLKLKNSRFNQTPVSFPNNVIQFSEPLLATVFQCKLSLDHLSISAVSLTLSDTHCSVAMNSYLRPSSPISPGNATDMAICSKIAYGQLNPVALLEWFEMQQHLGVSKILVHAYVMNITWEAMKIFEHYKSTGLVELIPFTAPGIDKYPRRHFYQQIADERLAIFDCLLRVGEFGYFIALDKDEVILPSNEFAPGALKRYVRGFISMYKQDGQFQLNRLKLASLTFKSQYHLTEWGEENSPRTQYFKKYQKCSKPIPDRHKFIMKPNRVQYWHIGTHDHIPRAQYISLTADPSMAVIHHYRQSRDSYDVDTRNNQKTKGLTPDGRCPGMATISDIVQPSVVNLLKHLKLH